MLRTLAMACPECQKELKHTGNTAMASISKDNVSYRLLNKLSTLVICSRCLRSGIVTPVPQIISGRHSLTNECAECRAKSPERHGHSGKPAKLLTLRN